MHLPDGSCEEAFYPAELHDAVVTRFEIIFDIDIAADVASLPRGVMELMIDGEPWTLRVGLRPGDESTCVLVEPVPGAA